MITRNNYEEYFLMYVDNELSAAERNAVEEFVQQNPDLAMELTMIQEAVFKPENDVVFGQKESLLKQTEKTGLINLDNYEEYFLLYLDNELDTTTKKQVEDFVSRNPAFQNEWDVFQQTKLEADSSIIFEGKESLYKKEERRVLPLVWIASAAAVAVLLVTGFLFFNRTDVRINDNPKTIAQNDTSKKEKIESAEKTSVAVTSSNDDSLNKTNSLDKKRVASTNVADEKRDDRKINEEKINKEKIEKKSQPSKELIAQENKTESHKEKEAITNNKQNEDFSKTNNLASVETVGTKKEIISTNATASDVKVAPNKLIVVVDQPDEYFKTNNNQSAYTKLASTTVEDPYATNDESEKKTKLRGIFRRVSRVFNKNENADNDSSKRSVSIGSFQIALK